MLRSQTISDRDEIDRTPELLRFYERLLKKEPGTCVGVYQLVPIFESKELLPCSQQS